VPFFMAEVGHLALPPLADRVAAGSSAPELFGRQPRAFGYRCQFGPHHVGIAHGLADPGAEAAIAAGDDVVAAD